MESGATKGRKFSVIGYSETQITRLVEWIVDKGVNGIQPFSSLRQFALPSAMSLGDEFRYDSSFSDDIKRVNALIRYQTARNFTSGFISGIGGLITLPVAIPTALAASWAIQACMVGAIAHICGHNIGNEKVRTVILLCLTGNSAKETMKSVGLEVAKKFTLSAVDRIPAAALVQINKAIGMRLLARAGEKGIISVSKAVPLVGGAVSGTVDATACYYAGHAAKKIFMTDFSLRE